MAALVFSLSEDRMTVRRRKQRGDTRAELDISAGKTQKNMFLSSKQLKMGGKKSSSVRENNCFRDCECVHCLVLYANVHCTAACLSRKSRNVGTSLSRHVA